MAPQSSITRDATPEADLEAPGDTHVKTVSAPLTRRMSEGLEGRLTARFSRNAARLWQQKRVGHTNANAATMLVKTTNHPFEAVMNRAGRDKDDFSSS